MNTELFHLLNCTYTMANVKDALLSVQIQSTHTLNKSQEKQKDLPQLGGLFAYDAGGGHRLQRKL